MENFTSCAVRALESLNPRYKMPCCWTLSPQATSNLLCYITEKHNGVTCSCRICKVEDYSRGYSTLKLCKILVKVQFVKLTSKVTPHLSVFSLNAGKYGPEKVRIRTIFMKCNTEPRNKHLIKSTNQWCSFYSNYAQFWDTLNIWTPTFDN